MKDACSTRGVWRMTLVVAMFCGIAAGMAWSSDTVPVGVAKVEITPDTPIRMYGYASRTTESAGIAGPLTAKALVIGDDAGEGPAVLLTVDCGAVPDDIVQQVYARVSSQTKIARERFVLCNSHNHSGPDLKELMGAVTGGEQERLARYGRQLTDRLAAVVAEALAARTPGRLALARGTVGFAVNRRVLQDGKWTGFGAVSAAPADQSLPVLKVTREDGSLLALMANYACHNTTLRGDFQQIHGDWAGCAQQCIEADHPGALALISIGCGADSDPCPHGTVALCEQHGRELADEVRRLVNAGSWTPVSPTLTARRKTLDIPWTQHPNMDLARRIAPQSWAVQSALQRLDQGQSLPDAQVYQLVTWAWGDDLAMVFLSDEVVVDYALRLQRELDASRLWISAYCHDVSTYIVSDRLIDEGGYELQNSLSNLVTFGQPETLQPSLEDRIIGTVKAMLPQTFQPPRDATAQ